MVVGVVGIVVRWMVSGMSFWDILWVVGRSQVGVGRHGGDRGEWNKLL